MARTLNFVVTLILVFLLTCSILPVTNGANPVFDSNGILQYESIPEEDDNYEVGQLVATDTDVGDVLIYGIQNAAPQYLSGSTGDAFNFLRVTEDGKVFTKAPIDRETFSSLRAAWTVQDNLVVIVQTPPVFLTVLDINDNDPYFQTMPSRLDPQPENSANLSVVHTFTIVDRDEGASGTAQAMFGTIPNTICEAEVFELVATSTANTFDLRLVRTEDELDYAVQSEYTICIYAEDEGNPSLNSTVSSVIIPIEDLQNLPPVFLNQPYDEIIPEDLAMGEPVLTVTAQDGDRGVLPPNEIRYEMNSTNFIIDPSSGVITVSEGLDREITSSYILTVNATELDYSQPEEDRTTFTQVFITIEDVDDNQPTFEPDTVMATIAENSPNGSPLSMELNVNDDDTPDNAGFILTLDQDGDAFRLQGSEYTSSARVDVRVNNNTYLNYEERETLTFQVIATSTSSTLYISVANVTVSITDVNDNTPTFLNESYEGSFPEDAAQGYSILTVEAIDGDGAEVTYSISSSEFNINDKSGEITTAEEGSNAELRTSYTFTVTASDGERSGAVLVTLECTDVNDNTPQFQRSDYQFFENEFNDVIPTGPIGTVQATDFDTSPPNNEIVYSIEPGIGSDKFTIDETTGDISFADFVDYETDVKFELTVVAADKGEPSLNATTLVTVDISDINDNFPTFSQELYDFAIFENAINGEFVGQVNATDEDSSYNGQVDYTILSGSRDSFYINSEGIIRTSGNLDRDVFANYTLEVLARDRGTPQGQDNCTVVITLSDINNKPPLFDPDVYDENVDEDVSSGYSIVTLVATDSDEDTDLVFYITSVEAFDDEGSIASGNFSYQFDLDDETGELTVNEMLDRERVQTFILNVEVIDRNTDDGDDTDTATVTVNVQDVNDETPVFQQLPYNFDVLEGAAVGTVVSTVISAIDLDQGNNAVITYSLEDDANGKFDINPDDGTLTVKDVINREEDESFTLVVKATDSGNPPQSNTTQVFINVLDINDNSPVFNESLCQDLKILENSTVNSSVCSVYATDEDSVFGTITYSIQGGNTDGWFQINNSTGEITVASELDRETAEQVILNINAEDPGQRQATQDVTITITDVNDEKPVFTLFINSVETTESTEADVALATVRAEDSDKPGTRSSEVRYSITEGPAELFKIDEEAGVVSTKQSLSNSAGEYSLLIMACDRGEEPLCSEEREMTITVADVNDDRPEFYFPNPDGSTIVEIVEGYNDTTTPLFQAKANDSDIGENGEVYYRFFESPGDDADWRSFRVDPVKGFVYFIGDPPDWYVKKEYELTLEAYNNNTENGLSSSATFTVQVLDTIDSPPYFWDPETEDAVPPRQELEMNENQEENVVGTIDVATERDENQPVYYFIVSGNDDELFSLDPETGVLSTTQEIDNDDGIASYELIIKVTNDSNFQVESKRKRDTTFATYNPATDPTLLTVVVTVIDTNNNPPIFISDRYTAGVLYTVDFDVSIAQVEVTDLDIDDENTQVKFEIVSQVRIDLEDKRYPDEAFSIDENTGVISTQTSFLSLSLGIYFDLNITATDPNKPEYTDATKVFIAVITESQQLSVHVLNNSDIVRAFSEDLKSLFKTILEEKDGNGIQLSVDFDKISTYTNGTEPVADESEILFHVLELTGNTVLPAPDVLYDLDHSPSYIDEVKDKYFVDTIMLASNPPPTQDFTFFQWIVMVLAIVFFLLLLLVILAFYFSKKQHERILKAYGIKNEYEIPAEVGKLPGTNAYTGTQSNPVYDNPTYERDVAPFGEEEEEVSKADSASHASEEAVMDMDDDEEDHYQNPDAGKGNSNLLDQILKDYDKKEEAYAHKIHMAGLEVSDV